jgi:transcriptional regulator with GAF, ATPase, and Fis domain
VRAQEQITVADDTEPTQGSAVPTIEPAMAFERLIADVSAAVVSVKTGALDQGVTDALGRVAEFFGADRGTVLQHRPAEGVIVRTHLWTRGGMPEPLPASQPDAAFPWLVEHVIRKQEILAVARLDELPPEAARDREGFERGQVRSGAMIPMVVEGRAVGYLSFTTVQHEQHWSRQLLARLRLVAETIGNALARAETEASLRAALAENERLRERLAAEKVYFQEQAEQAQRFGEVVGESAAIRATLAKVDQVAATDVTVLLLGETGTGKELLARALHQRSRRHDRPFIAVNCAALPATLIESELFGYERGAFTGATQSKPGRFDLADGGTLFLDEIGDLELALQSTLLRVLQDGEIQRLGSTTARRVDVRIIAATNRDLRQAMQAGSFRDDLWYRLSVFPIEVPPLRDRRADIPLLVWHLIRARQRALGRAIQAVLPEAMDQLTRYDWPGNVRELQNVIDRALILSLGPDLRVEEAMGSGAATVLVRPSAAGEGLRETERRHIAKVLQECNWQVEGPGQAAERLQLRPSTLRNRMKRLGLRRPQ